MIDAGPTVHARLRELSTGDVVDLAVDSIFLSRSSRSCQIIEALKALGDHGLVRRSETVSADISQMESSAFINTPS